MIPLGILAAQVAAPAGAYELISTTILTSNTASVTFSSIPQNYKHLQVRIVGRTNQSESRRAIAIRLNGDTGSNYAWHNLNGDGSTVTSFAGSSQNVMFVGQTSASAATANGFGASVIDVLDYSSTNKNKTLRSLAGVHSGVNNFIRLMSGFRNNTDAVNSITFLAEDLTSSFVSGSRFSLYGIRGN